MKEKTLESISESRSVQNANEVNSHVTAVVGVAGIGGVDKTTALNGLAQDAKVLEKFSTGGIYFLVVRKDATPASLVVQLKEMVKRSGGKKRCEETDSDGSLESAVRTTSS